MRDLNGPMLALIAGIIYVAFALVMGWEAGGLPSSIIWVAVAATVTVSVITVLTRLFPTARVWVYPLMFSLPLLLLGAVALTDNFTVATIGSGTFLVGLGAAFIAQRRARNHPRSNPPLNTDAPPSGGAPVS